MKRRTFLRQGAALGLGTVLADLNGISRAESPASVTSASPRELVPIRRNSEFENAGSDFGFTIVKGLNLSRYDFEFWERAQLDNSYFLGCEFRNREIRDYVESKSAYFFRRVAGLAYDPFRSALYSPEDLMRPTAAGSIWDKVVYDEYLENGKLSANMIEALNRRVHDFSMGDALGQLTREIPVTDMVCITGGFFQDRTDAWFRKTAEAARLLALDGKFIVTGGGPGTMEAANLGAYLSAYDNSALASAIEILAQAPEWTDDDWLKRSLEVLEKFPNGKRSLGIPTWFYGFEPTNLFATDIAKYFDNDLREGILMGIAKGGAVFAPGAAGARQEIFMVATQNHFGSTGYFYPMVLFGKDHYEVETNVYQLLLQVANDNYKDLVYSTDDPADVVAFIRENPPRESKVSH